MQDARRKTRDARRETQDARRKTRDARFEKAKLSQFTFTIDKHITLYRCSSVLNKLCNRLAFTFPYHFHDKDHSPDFLRRHYFKSHSDPDLFKPAGSKIYSLLSVITLYDDSAFGKEGRDLSHGD